MRAMQNTKPSDVGLMPHNINLILSSSDDGLDVMVRASSRAMVEKAIYRTLSRNLRAARRSAGMTQEELAFATGFGRDYISDIETAKASVSLARLAVLAAAVGSTPHALISPGGHKEA